jgi:hypothetical protein
VANPLNPFGRGGARWAYYYGPHFMSPETDSDASKGMVRDAPRTAIPTSGVYDSADFLLHEPGLIMKRGGTAYAGPAMAAATYAAAVSYAQFPAGAQLLGIGDNGHLYKITSGTTTDVSTLGTAFVPKQVPRLRVGGGTNLLLIPANDGTTAPKSYDGTTVANFGGSPPAGKYVEVYKTRFVLGNTSANPNRLFFSPTPDPTTTWDTTNSWIDCDFAITGLAATSNMLLIFSSGATERIVGSTPPPGSDMDRTVIGSVGCTDARSIVKQENNVLFANTRGVYLTNGAGFASLTDEGAIATYWQSLFSGYDASTWTISAGVFRTFYFVTILDASGNLVTSLMCNVPRRAWWRLTNTKPVMYAQAVSGQEELYYADRTTNRVVAMSGIFTPTSSNESDANGTAVQPLIDYRLFGSGPGLKAFGNGRLTYNMPKSTGSPTLAVSISRGIGASSYSAVAESPLAFTTDVTRKRFSVNGDGQGVNVRLQQAGASTRTDIFSLETEIRPYPQTRDGQ